VLHFTFSFLPSSFFSLSFSFSLSLFLSLIPRPSLFPPPLSLLYPPISFFHLSLSFPFSYLFPPLSLSFFFPPPPSLFTFSLSLLLPLYFPPLYFPLSFFPSLSLLLIFILLKGKKAKGRNWTKVLTSQAPLLGRGVRHKKRLVHWKGKLLQCERVCVCVCECVYECVCECVRERACVV